MLFLKRIGSMFVLFFDMLHVTFQLLYGFWKVSKLKKPVVTIFGSARIEQDQIFYKQAQELAQRFIDNDISVLTGGGPGIMQAVSCGAEEIHDGVDKGKSIGIGVTGLDEKRSLCVGEYFELDYFFARKWLLTHYSAAFIIFPGGFGTLDELGEILTLMQTKQMGTVPIILIGKEFWAPFMEWVNKQALEHKMVSKENVALFTVTDDLEQAFCAVRDECKVV